MSATGRRVSGGRRLAPPQARRVALLFLVLCPLGTGACRGQNREDLELRAAVDSLLPRLESLAGLRARRPVGVARRGRAELRRYVLAQLGKELPPAEAEGIEATYRALGLFPDTLDLRRLLLELYTEQVMGYYDPETDTLYVMEGVPRDVLEPVLAHELVHALQDQYVDLDSLVSRRRGNDRQLAAQAAIEGQATLVMFGLLAERMAGQPIDLAALPDLGPQLRPGLEAQNRQFPVFQSAPRIIRETLLFPYLGGAGFVQALWRHAAARGPADAAAGEAARSPPPAPFGSLLPLSTEQVLHAETHFLQSRDAPTELRFSPGRSGSAADAATRRRGDAALDGEVSVPPRPRVLRSGQGVTNWKVLYENTLGELEISILLEEHLGGGAGALARGWDGDRYRLLEGPGGTHALVWYSVWDDAAAAEAFADAYRRILTQRSALRHGRAQRSTVQDRPVVLVLDAPRQVLLDSLPIPSVELKNGP